MQDTTSQQPDRQPDLRTRVIGWLAHGSRWGTQGQPKLLWRVVVPLVFGFAGFLFVTSAESAEGDDLRPDRETGLTSLVEDERDGIGRMRARASALSDEIEQLTASVDDAELNELNEQLAELRTHAGLVELRGPGVEIVLDDAPYDQPIPPGRTANDLIVHQQDLQAVVNALWDGGAEGVTLQGQRIVSTTGIKCHGNTVVLEGVPYAPPYRIVAVGDVTGLMTAITTSQYIQIYKQYTEPPINIGYSQDVLADVTLPAYDGALGLEYARTS
ncbi:MAG: DUF881 domain-containing protein [Nocardioidaceae bacterium]